MANVNVLSVGLITAGASTPFAKLFYLCLFLLQSGLSTLKLNENSLVGDSLTSIPTVGSDSVRPPLSATSLCSTSNKKRGWGFFLLRKVDKKDLSDLLSSQRH